MLIRKNNKAQAALEFLTTYGWAFLVILLMMGTLAYFGILSPGRVLPGRCTFGAEFQCLDYQIVQTGAAPNPQLKLRLKNSVGLPIDITSFTLTKDDGGPITCTPNATISGWRPGYVKDLAWTSCSGTGWVAQDKIKVLVILRYNSVASGSGYSKDVQGEVFTTVI